MEKMSKIEGEAKRGLIEATGLLFEKLGMARSRGIVWGLIYFSAKPLSLDHMVQALGISKGSASTATRDLLQLEAIRQVWVEGDRKDYFEATAEMGAFVKNVYANVLLAQFRAFDDALDTAQTALTSKAKNAKLEREDALFCKARVDELQELERKLSKLGPAIRDVMDSL